VASRKEHEILIALNAAINGNFQGTFSKAQQEFAKLGKEIQNLHKLQGNISTYQKQEQAVVSTTQKLENLRQQEALLSRQIEAAKDAKDQDAASIAALEREKLKLEQRIGSTVAALERQNQRLDATGAKLKEAGVDTANLSQKDTELTAKIKELQEEQDKAAEGALTFGERSAQAFDVIQQTVAAAGIAAAVKEIADAYMECVSVAADFQEAMSTVEALSQANAQEMAALTAEAKELGATTKFTAQEAGDAMGYMAMAGWNAQEMLSGMNGVLNLAAASGEDLANVSDIVTDSLSAFKLTAADSAHFSDVLAQAATKSNTNVSIMGESFKYAASLCGTLGYSVEDAAVNLGIMANNGIKGSQAGTALKTSLANLSAPTKEQAEMMDRLGISMTGTGGEMLSLAELTGSLRSAFSGLSEVQQSEAASTLFGKEAMAGMLAIINTGQAEYDSLTASIQNSAGAAERMAKIKLDNLNGDLTLMNSAMEALQITVGEQFNPELRDLAQLGTGLLNGANEFIRENPALVRGVMAGAGAFAAMGAAIVSVNAAMKVFSALNLASLLASAGPLLGVAGIIAGVTAAVAASTREVQNATYASEEQRLRLEELNAEYENAVSLYGETSEEAGRLRYEINELTQEYEQSIHTAKELAQQHDDLITSVEESAASYQEAAAESRESALDAAALAAKLKELASAGNQSSGELELMSGIIDELNSRFQGLGLNLDDVTSGSDWKAMLDNYIRQAAEAAEKSEALSRSMELIREKSRLEEDRGAYEKEIEAAEADVKRLQALNEGNNYWGIGPYSEQLAAAQTRLHSYRGSLEETNSALADNAEEYENLLDVLGGQDAALDDSASKEEQLQAALDGTMAKVQELTGAYEEAYAAALESFQGQFGLFDEAKADADASVEAAQRALDSQLSYWQGYAGNIATLKEISAEDLGVTQENYNKLMEYVRSGTPEAAGLAASMVEEVNKGNTKSLTNLANTLGEISESQDQAAQDMADWTTGLTGQMDQLILDMGEDVRSLNMGPDAAKAAESTIQSYIDQAEDMLPRVRAVFGQFRSAVNNALGGAYAGSYFDIPGHGYASGTSNAPPGWAWVGEEGPELIHMRGGETVLPAEVSREFSILNQFYNNSEMSAYAGGTDDAETVMREIVNTEYGNTVYNAYNTYNAYNEAAYNSAYSSSGVTGNPFYSSPAGPSGTAISAIEAIPGPAYGGGTTSPIAMEVHIHIDGNASTETAQAIREVADEIVDKVVVKVLDALDDRNADAARRAMQ